MALAASPKDGGRGLERDMVVTAALQLLDEVGFNGLTQRRLAERLNVKAAALYWHFENKQDLIDAVAERIMLTEFKHDPSQATDWRSLLTTVAHVHRRALMRYRDGAEVMAHANLRNHTMFEGLESLLKVLREQGFTAPQAMHSFFAIIRFTLGCVFEEQADPHPKSATPAERRQRITEMAKDYPTVAQGIADTMAGKGRDYMFECGLRIILDGIAQQIEKPLDPAHNLA
ncbi:MAG TPA: TetR/AcrR family transcriptional regulator C-terminal domain-containing protein [Candidatus Saccharimonadales bacterium]|nr:TetR/AcrR family transcriptional regulator C-terminal domain-containing protein [Candidatus Saccharimonadales bacterium]